MTAAETMHKDAIQVLEDLARTNQEKSREIGFAIGLLRYCMKNEITTKQDVLRLPSPALAVSRPISS